MDQAVCCYRHPGRETGIRCSRCDRPICPDCMVSASVGFHCPECVSEGRRTAPPPPRTIAGGALTANPRLVTIILIAINVAVFIAEQLNGSLELDYGLIGPAIAHGQWYRLVTAMFLHEGPTHIGLNMLSLWWIGPSVEAALGRARYLTLYMLSGFGGSALSFLLSPANTLGLGASGAIFGLLGALFILVRRVRGDMRPIVILIVLNLVFSFAVANIDWRAHVGGLVTGVVIAIGMVYAPRQRRALVQWGTCAAMFVVALGVIAAAAAQYTG
jgi:membrane associated rhomboid family serine protease